MGGFRNYLLQVYYKIAALKSKLREGLIDLYEYLRQIRWLTQVNFGEIESAIASVQDVKEIEPVRDTSAQSSTSDSTLVTAFDAINSFQEPPVLTQGAFSGEEMMLCPNGCGESFKAKSMNRHLKPCIEKSKKKN
jgi:hypothetical protein